MKSERDSGNAIVELIAFGLLFLVPLAAFAASSAMGWVAKQRAIAAATQLARAASQGSAEYQTLKSAYSTIYPEIEVVETSSVCCVSILVHLGTSSANAKAPL